MAGLNSLKTRFLSLGLKLARWPIFRPLVRFGFEHMDQFFPVERLAENEHWLAFQHPQPEYPLHILIVPKKAVPNLVTASLDSGETFIALFEIVQTLIKLYDLEDSGYRLITNGGPNQTIPQWHWHLISAGWQEAHD